MKIKRSLLVGATLTTLAGGIASVGLVSAATDTSTNSTSSSSSSSSSSLVDKIAAKFKLKKADVQAVFDADRTERDAARETAQKEKLATAVKDGKLTQAQADHITQALAEIKTLRGDADPKTASDTVRDQVKTKLDELRSWAQTNNVDMQYIMFGHGGGHGPGGRGGFGGPDGAGAPGEKGSGTSSDSSSSSTSN